MAQIWYCLIDSHELGPFDSTQLRSLANQKKLLPSHFVRQNPGANWTMAVEVKGLFATNLGVAQPPATLPSDRRWWVKIGARELGPFTDNQLKHYATTGELRPEHSLRIEGQSQWHDARKVKGLFDIENTNCTVSTW